MVRITTGSSRPAWRTRSTSPSTSTHHESAGCPSRKSSIPSWNGTSSPAASSFCELVVADAVEDEQGAEVVELHQVIAR